MLKFVLKKLLMVIPTMLGIVLIVFVINKMTPGDPVALMLGSDYTQEQYDETREELGLDKPVLVQFYDYIKNIITEFDFGTSYATKRPVSTEIKGRIWVSVKLGLLSTLFTVLLGIPFGVISATKQYSAMDYSVTFLSLFFSAVPNFWLSMMLILLFSLQLKWFPASGLDSLSAYVIPMIATSVACISQVTRQTRSSMLEVIRQDYIRTAKAKGLSEMTIIYKHALKNALIPVITIVGMQIGMIFGGSAVIEAIHNIPGMGTLLLSAIGNRDYPTIQSIVLVISAMVCLMNVVVDIVYGFVDPRIRAQYVTVKKKKGRDQVEAG